LPFTPAVIIDGLVASRSIGRSDITNPVHVTTRACCYQHSGEIKRRLPGVTSSDGSPTKEGVAIHACCHRRSGRFKEHRPK
ncbi:hypothetical protein MTO96_050392, partial [Rhipicephalus appendiculatus]